MILQALYKLAEREHLMEDPDFVQKPIAWLVQLNRDGKFLGLQSTKYIPAEEQKRKKPKTISKKYMVPREKERTRGDRAFFLYDKAEYVFGQAPLDEKDKKRSKKQLKSRFKLFKKRIEECFEESRDQGVKAVLAFLGDIEEGKQETKLPDDCAGNDLFAFIVRPDEQLVSDREKVREYWKKLRVLPEETGEQTKKCLVTGESIRGAIDNFPQIKKVPGKNTAKGISFVSFNKSAFESYGLDGNENAPIARASAEACAEALNRLLDSNYISPVHPEKALPNRHLRLSDDTVVCFWSNKKVGDAFCSVFSGLLEANPSNVKELYQSIWRGKKTSLEDESVFYALTLTGQQGRAIVRDWFETTVAEVDKNLSRHFYDLDIVRNTPKPKEHDHPPQFTLRRLLESLAAGGESKNIPAPYIIQLLHAALHGTAYPFSILQRALERMRAEIGKDEWLDLDRRDARVALIKAVLNRRKRYYPDTTHYPEVKREMDPTNNSEGYILGKLMAVLERIQQAAMENVNASVIDRYFSGASASPKSVFVRLLKNARHHARKAKDNASTAGIAFLTERLIDELTSRFDPKNNGFPAHLDLEQQGLFVLGYHQMRHWLWMTKEERGEWENRYPEASKAYVWHSEKAAVGQ